MFDTAVSMSTNDNNQDALLPKVCLIDGKNLNFWNQMVSYMTNVSTLTLILDFTLLYIKPDKDLIHS